MDEASAPQTEGEGGVEIHKPKRWHAAREFFKEYLIIVIGVLTALGAEQVAEQLHWKHLAGEHEEDLRDGARQMMGLAVEKLAATPCTRGALEQTAAVLRSPGPWKGLNPSADKSPSGFLLPMFLTQSRPWPTDAWDSAVSDGALPHMPREKVASYAIIYRTGRVSPQQEIQRRRSELTPLAFDATLSPQERAQYLISVARIDQQEIQAAGMARTIIWLPVSKLGLRPDPKDVKARMDQLAKRMPQGCTREVDVEAIARTNRITYTDGSVL